MVSNGMASDSELERVKARAELTEKILGDLQIRVAALKQAAVKEAGLAEEEKLRKENAELKIEIEKMKKALVMAEIGNGVRQVYMPTKAELAKFSAKAAESSSTVAAGTTAPPAKVEGEATAKGETGGKKTKQTDKAEAGGKKAKQDKGAKGDGGSKPKKTAAASGAGGGEGGEAQVDISRLDMRVGKIVAIEKHPDADSLYVEQVDLGEGRNRSICSGLVKHIPINAMKDRFAVFMCNLKPAKMRGVLSEGMIMCASGSDKVEILIPPADSAIGDRVTVDEYPGTPDPQLNPKKKIWETLKPDVRTNSDRVATYKGAVFKIEGKGVVVAPTLADTQIS
ncbi:hypothetical protein RRG08_028304 [Elysia crispata]|uniref:tRNA-binding domain-containing protein n=1 Tax=Elysia crispata TaxID=231223 RepID=A0AAE1E6X5_9GAST|nr:hypothetical protein RRG08_028304 [Elysia crispata]